MKSAKWDVNMRCPSGSETQIFPRALVDHLYERKMEKVERFETLFIVVFFGLLILLKVPQHKLVNRILSTPPNYMPDFYAMDLWLRRVAIKQNPSVVDVVSTEGTEYRTYAKIIKEMYQKGMNVF